MTEAVDAALAAYEKAAQFSMDASLVADMDAKIAALTDEEMAEFTKRIGGSAR